MAPLSPREELVPIPPSQDLSVLQMLRLKQVVPLPPSLSKGPCTLGEVGEATEAVADKGDIRGLFPSTYGAKEVQVLPGTGEAKKVRIGVVLSGGQAAGGHNVIAGIFDRVTENGGTVFGFVGGPHGVYSGEYVTVDATRVAPFRNQGGFHMIGSGRHKIETPEQFEASLRVAQELDLDGIVVIGGDDSNTNAAVLAEYFTSKGAKCAVVGCPKTIDGDLKCDAIEASFGFDTACRTFSELIGNIALDGASSRKYHNFVRLMGRSASHITLECALQTCPNLCLVGEEAEANGWTLSDLTNQICDLVCERHAAGMDHSVIVMPEGLVEFVPEMRALIAELNDLLATPAFASDGGEKDDAKVSAALSDAARATFDFLPSAIRAQLLLERDPHGNVQVSRIETEKLLILLTSAELARRKSRGEYGGNFQALGHFFGYEGRSGLPSHFDSMYCSALGQTAARLVEHGRSGYIASIRGLCRPVSEWKVGAVPLTSLMNMEKRKGKMKPVIRKALVELDAGPFQVFKAVRDQWRLQDRYRNPGPIQFASHALDERTFLLRYEQGEPADPVHDHVNGGWGQKVIAPPKDGGAHPFHPWRDASQFSALQKQRAEAPPSEVPVSLSECGSISVSPCDDDSGPDGADIVTAASVVRHMFPVIADYPLLTIGSGAGSPVKATQQKIAVALMGRQCPGGHNVIEGLLDYVEAAHPGSQLLGFLGGSKGMVQGSTIEITREMLSLYRNQGGYDLLGRTRDDLSETDLMSVVSHATKLGLTGIVLLGGAKTVPVAIRLANAMRMGHKKTAVTLVPATVDNDLDPTWVPTSLGFDTATSLFSTTIGNIGADAASARKYYYFIRLMGRQTSHVTLECALRTHPNAAIIGEEVRGGRISLDGVTKRLADLVCARSAVGKDFGLFLIPEGLVSLFPEIGALVQAISDAPVPIKDDDAADRNLPPWLAALYKSLPVAIRTQLLLARDSDGSLQLSHIDTEKLLIHTVTEELERRASKETPEAKRYKGKFSAIASFFGYQGRCALPSRFDCSLGCSLGRAAGAVIAAGRTGYVVTATGGSELTGPPSGWSFRAVPLARVVTIREASAAGKEKHLAAHISGEHAIDVHGPEARSLRRQRDSWLLHDHYVNPGPVQFSWDCPTAEPAAISGDGRSTANTTTADPTVAFRTATLSARCAGVSAVRQEIAEIARVLIATAEDDDSEAGEAELAMLRDALRSAAAGLAAAVRKNRVPVPTTPTLPASPKI